jgi:hypothetical protein
MEAPVCANAFEPSDKTPTNNKVPIFFIHTSNCIGKDCKRGGELLARRSLFHGVGQTPLRNRATAVRAQQTHKDG